MKNILITGGGGYIGTNLTNELLRNGFSVTAVDTFWFGNYLKKHKRLKVIKKDIREISKNDLNSRNKPRKKYEIKFKILTNDELKILKNYKCGLKKIMGREFMGVVRSAFLIDSKDKIVEFLKNIKVKDHTQNVLICFSI